jgi:DNA-3-methyladenine glycosylase I
MRNPGIVRNKLKVESAIKNAKAFLVVQREHGSFDDYIWNLVGNETLHNRWQQIKDVPARTALSDLVSKDLKRRGFNFVGSTIVYAFMQSAGIVNDHLVACPRHKAVRG